MKRILPFFLFTTLACTAQPAYQPIGTIERYDSSINVILSPAAKADKNRKADSV